MIPAVSHDRLAALVGLLVCPGCHGALRRDPEALHCEGCAKDYPIRLGRPVFVEDPATVRVMPAGHLSNQPPAHILDWLRGLGGWVLNVGAGGTRVKLPHVVELEYAIFRHTDVSADAHHLPFPDATFEAVVTFNTFEHLHDPPRAAREIYRVLKPGGKLLLHTAFLQPLHEAPHHYYNATAFGVRRWFAQFDIRDVTVSPNFSPSYMLAWLSHEILTVVEQQLGTVERRLLEHSPLRLWAAAWPDAGQRQGILWDVLDRLPPEAKARFAAGFQLEATKPVAPPL